MSSVGHNSESICGNWIAVSREMRDHYLVGFGQPVKAADSKRGAFSRAEAWLDLIMLARWKDGVEVNKGRKTEMRAGQFQGGYSWLASRWNWTVQTVRTFIGKLLGEGMLDREKNDTENNTQKSNQVQTLSICNYKRYQLITELAALRDQQANNKRATSEQQHLNKGNTIDPEESLQDSSGASQPDLLGSLGVPSTKRSKRAVKTADADGEYPEDFNHFWKIYPRKVGKGSAFKIWKKLSLEQRRRAWLAVRRESEVLEAKTRDPRGNFCPHPATWLGGRRFDDDPESMPQRQMNGHHAKPSMDEIWLDRQIAEATREGLLA